MASLPIAFGTTTVAAKRRVFSVPATKGSAAGPTEEKSLWDWFLVALQKEAFVETDPLLNKVEDKAPAPTSGGRGKSGTVVVPAKKKNGGFGGLGGLFAQK